MLHSQKRHAAIATLGLAFAVCSCSSVKPPEQTLGAARMAVEEAERLDAGQYAQGDLEKAQDKLESSELEMERENYVSARRFAEQAVVDANLARARAVKAKSFQHVGEAQDALTDVTKEAYK